MSPDSLKNYHHQEKISNFLFAIKECPVPVIVEFANGDEVKIQKVYHVGGGASCVKILVDELLENPKDLDELENIKSEVKVLKEEKRESEGEIEELKEELEKWTNDFGDDPESTKTIWDEIEEAVRHFGQIAEINLVSNDATNICRLQDEYENKTKLLLEAGEIIAELKVDNKGLAWNIQELTNQNESLKLRLEEIESAAEDKKFN